MSEELYVCSKCGSLDVAIAMWVDPNSSTTEGIGEPVAGSNDLEMCWCTACDDNTTITFRRKDER